MKLTETQLRQVIREELDVSAPLIHAIKTAIEATQNARKMATEYSSPYATVRTEKLLLEAVKALQAAERSVM